MPFQLAKIDKYKDSILIFLNTYFFWLVIQTIRGFALTTSFEAAFSLIGLALILVLIEFLLQGFMRNLIAAKVGLGILTIFLIIINLPVLPLTDFENYYLFLLIGYGIFFPGFYDYISKAKNDSNNQGAILIVISFICGFLANLIERYFILTFNPILNLLIIYVITPLFCIGFIIFFRKDRGQEVPEKKKRSSFKDIVKMRVQSIVCSLIIACVFILQMVLYNNPSLIGISILFDYDLTVFFIILTYAIFVFIILFFSFQFETKDKRFQLLILILNGIVLATFLLGFLFHSPIQMVISLISNIIILFLLVVILAYSESAKIQISFLTILLVTLVFYLLSSAFGIYRFVLLIISLIMVISSLFLFLFSSNQELSLSYKKRRDDNV